jgi:hypothetical protein
MTQDKLWSRISLGNYKKSQPEYKYLDDFIINEKHGKKSYIKLARLYNKIKSADDFYFESKKSFTSNGKYSKDTFFNSFYQMIQEFQNFTFKELTELQFFEEKMVPTGFNYRRARNISRLSALICSVPHDSINRGTENNIAGLPEIIEAMLKLSTLIEHSNKTLIDKMISVYLDKTLVKAILHINKTKGLTPAQKFDIKELFIKRMDHLLSFRQIMVFEKKWAAKIVDLIKKERPAAMFFLFFLQGDPMKDYNNLLEMYFNNASQEDMIKKIENCNFISRILIPDFTKADKKITELNTKITFLSKGEFDFSIKEKDHETKELKPFNPLDEFGISWDNFEFQ